MKKRLQLMALAACATMSMWSAQVAAITADELIEKNIAARGGEAAIRAMQSVRKSGKFSGGGGRFEMQISSLNARPNLYRSDGTLQGMTVVQAFDGKAGWQIQPFGGRKDPIPMSEDDLKGMSDAADFDGPLMDAKAKGNQIEYLGMDDVDGTPAHKLKVSKKNGDIKYIFLDPDYFLEIRVQDVRFIRGEANESETDVGSYEKFGGVYFPMSIEMGGKGDSEKGAKITIEKIELNVEVDPASFKFPETAQSK